MTEPEERPTNNPPASFFFWVPMIILAALLALWVYTSVSVEPPVRRLLETARTHIEHGRTEFADRDIHAAISLTKHKIDVYDLAVQLYAQSPDLPMVIKDQHILALSREELDLNDRGKLDRKLEKGEILTLLGRYAESAYSLSTRDDALWAAERAYKLSPDNPLAANELGYFLTEYDRELPRAERLINEALAALPGNPEIIDSLGWVHYKQRRYPDAVRELQKAVAGIPDSGELRLHLAMAYLAQGKNVQATIELRKAVICKDSNGSQAQAAVLLLRIQPQPKPRIPVGPPPVLKKLPQSS